MDSDRNNTGTPPAGDGPRPETPLSAEALYAAVGEQYRYFLTWRARLFAGYFAVLASLALAFAWLHAQQHYRESVSVPFIAALVSGIFWAFDYRIREQYRRCARAGRALEGDSGGVFSRLLEGQDETQDVARIIHHSATLNVMFGGVILAMLVATVLLCVSGGMMSGSSQ